LTSHRLRQNVASPSKNSPTMLFFALEMYVAKRILCLADATR